MVKTNAEDMPTCELSEASFTDNGVDIITILVEAALVTSRSEGRRAIEQGGVTVNGEKVEDFKAVFSKDDLSDEGLIVKRGKKNFKRVLIK